MSYYSDLKTTNTKVIVVCYACVVISIEIEFRKSLLDSQVEPINTKRLKSPVNTVSESES